MAKKLFEEEYRICNFCGCKFSEGMTDCCTFYSCETCFDKMVKNGEFTMVDDDGFDGYYLDEDGNGTGIFYTEWY